MFQFIQEHWVALLLALLAFIEVIVRLTPTEKDNRIFTIVKNIIDFFIPNRKKGGGLIR